MTGFKALNFERSQSLVMASSFVLWSQFQWCRQNSSIKGVKLAYSSAEESQCHQNFGASLKELQFLTLWLHFSALEVFNKLCFGRCRVCKIDLEDNQDRCLQKGLQQTLLPQKAEVKVE